MGYTIKHRARGSYTYGMWAAFIHFCSLYRNLAGLFIDGLTCSINLGLFTGVCYSHSYLPRSGSKNKGHIL